MENKIKEIIRQLGDIAEKTSHLTDGGSPPSIEIDIILQELRLLYTEVKALHTEKTEAVGRKSEMPPGEQSPEIKATDAQEPSEKESALKAASESPVPPARLKEDQEDKPQAEDETKAGTTTLADKYKGEKKFINESLAKTGKKQDIGSKIHAKPIRSIGSALGINDRFKLINDLFKGDKDSFQKTIAVLEDAPNFNEAFNHINSSFDWDMEDDSVQILLELVRRKFIVNENE